MKYLKLTPVITALSNELVKQDVLGRDRICEDGAVEQMKNSIFVVLFVVLFLSAVNVSGQTARSEIANPAVFAPIKTTVKIADCRGFSLQKCGRDAMVALDLIGFGGEDNFVDREEVFTFQNGVGIYLFSILGMRSDFTNEWRTRVAFTRTRTGYRFVQAGMQYRCMENGVRSKWAKTECEGAAAGDAEGPTSQHEIENVDDFRFISVTGRGATTLSQPCRGSLEECGRRMFEALYRPDAFDSITNIRTETFTFQRGGSSIGVYLVTGTGYEDDSVRGERIRVEFENRRGVWHAKGGSRQFLCARGSDRDKWTEEFCP